MNDLHGRLKHEGMDAQVSSGMVETLTKLRLNKYAMTTLKDYTNSMLSYARYCTKMRCRFLPGGLEAPEEGGERSAAL
jgi:hypothetical protein